jgi:hypothetical protein
VKEIYLSPTMIIVATPTTYFYRAADCENSMKFATHIVTQCLEKHYTCQIFRILSNELGDQVTLAV